jgi:tetratricopeptide (TPR) repeat protein/nucleoside phosphorylase
VIGTAPVDVLIIAALAEELGALLEVDPGGGETWTSVAGNPPYHVTTLRGDLGPIVVAAARPVDTAGIATAALATTLIERLAPRCLAMCGVCAGAPGDTDVGDVIIASRVFQHDNGKRKPEGFHGDLTTHLPDVRWVRVMQDLCGPATGLHGYAPAPPDAGRWWLLEQLRCERDPMTSVLERYLVGDTHTAVMTELLDEHGYVALEGERLVLTDAGREAIHRHRVVHRTAATERPYFIHSGAIGSGNYVAADGLIWKDLAEHEGQRKTLGVEQEAAAVGRVAWERGLPFVVAKGVMDHADRHKSDNAKLFAARVSAEVLCHFLRRVIAPATRGRGDARGENDTDVLFEGPHGHTAQQVQYFTGRDAELGRLTQLLLDNRTGCVVITGIGGVGKTTLAEEFVATCARRLFPAGAAWIDGRKYEQALGRVGRRFGWADEREPTPKEALDVLDRALHDKRFLIIVDNFDPERGSLENVPRPKGAYRTLVTSRSRTLDVSLDAAVLALGVWTPAACRYYLRERCEHLGSVADPELDALADFVGYLPLAIRLLVFLLRNRPGTSVSALLEMLAAKPLGVLDQHQRDRGIAVTFQASYDQLSDPAKRVLQALAVCARQTRAEVVGAVARVDDVLAQLDHLYTHGFAELSHGVDAPWGLHDIVRMFVLEQPGRNAFEASHEMWMHGHFTAHADPTAHQAFSAGVDEARVIFERLLARDPAEAESMSWPLVEHLRVVGRYPEAIALSEMLLAAVPVDSALASRALNSLGAFHATLGNMAKAIEFLERALSIEEKLDHLEGQASNLCNLGSCYRMLGDFLKAIELHERALAIDEKLGISKASNLSNLGLCYRMLGDFSKAIELHDRALAIHGELGSLEGQAIQLGNLGACHQLLGEIRKAVDLHERALAIDEKLGRIEGQAIHINNLGACFEVLGDVPKAIKFYERALAIDEKLGRREGQAIRLGNLAGCYEMLGDVPKAIHFLERGIFVYRLMGLPEEHPDLRNYTRAIAEFRSLTRLA